MPISVQPSDIVARNSYFIIADVTGKPCFHDIYNIWPGCFTSEPQFINFRQQATGIEV